MLPGVRLLGSSRVLGGIGRIGDRGQNCNDRHRDKHLDQRKAIDHALHRIASHFHFNSIQRGYLVSGEIKHAPVLAPAQTFFHVGRMAAFALTVLRLAIQTGGTSGGARAGHCLAVPHVAPAAGGFTPSGCSPTKLPIGLTVCHRHPRPSSRRRYSRRPVCRLLSITPSPKNQTLATDCRR